MNKDERVVQIGIVVRDIEESSKLWAKLLGTDVPKPIETGTADVTNMIYREEPSSGRAKLAFFSLQNITIELIEPIGGPSTWRDFLDRHGSGVHHIAFNTGDIDGPIKTLGENGIEVEQKGNFTGGCYA